MTDDNDILGQQAEVDAAKAQAEDSRASAEGKGKKGKKGNLLGRILGGDILRSKKVQKQLPLVLILCFYGLLLVGNRYQVESLTKEKLAAQDRIHSLRESSIELQRHYQESIKISAIAERLDSTGVGITAGPPFEI